MINALLQMLTVVVRENATVAHNLIKKPPADARAFCQTLRTEKNRYLLVLCSPRWMVAERVRWSAEDLGTSV